MLIRTAMSLNMADLFTALYINQALNSTTAFLKKEQQINYINAMISLYKEELPETLIERVKNLKNIKPEHLEKVVNQLKYMDAQEKIEFILFLEKHA